ncbi:ABC transporter ATP-binding protein [Aquibacillus rhizosphaerae]|uniref:ABC transporter ATP-binding protein n=1 Tax=Aquibacillus rhizosphaerae TaxID=3051431 RepID=A0ABT7L4R0_9BACI|nr:ABC transporter ATP-binding protein [Aquibacillus sp. LR5S19]MDL4840172.1 ABC transporter ATP-binding protein [Aquibacillus sp. LR5S19]
MKKIFSYVKIYKKSAVLALILMGLELSVELIQPIIMSIIIDEGIVGQDFQTIIIWLSVLIGLTLLAFAAGIVSSFFAADVSQSVGHDLRRDLFSRVQDFSAVQMQKLTASSLLTRITGDVTQVQAFLFMFLRIMLRAPLFIIGGIIMAFTVHVQLATILVIIVPVLLLIVFWILTEGIKLFRRVQVRLDHLNSIIRENLLGIRLVKAYNRNNHEQLRFNKVNNHLMDDNKKALQLMELTMPIVMLGMNISLVLLLWFGFMEINIGSAQAGEVVAIINYATRIMASFGVFGFLLMNFSRGKASATRISEVLESKPSQVIPKTDSSIANIEGHINFENITFSYSNMKRAALKDISVQINAGETVGILGETGSGKTTFLQLIPGLYKAKSGNLSIDNKPIKEWGRAIRDFVTLVPQEGFLFSGTIKENIAWGNEKAQFDDIVRAAKDANIHSYIMTLPDQYETRVGQRGVNLSGGQKQRLSIARALLANPTVLLLDDSTSALDANTEQRVLESIKSKSCTTVVVAQKISSVMDADKILVFDKGCIVASGNHQELIGNSPLYQKIYQSQMKEDGLS